MPDNDAEKIAANGAPYTFPDGREVHLRYTMTSLMWIEKHFGSLDKVVVNDGDPAYTKMLDFAAAGLLHENDENGPLTTGRLGDMLAPKDFDGLLKAANEAWAQAFPPVAEKTPPKKARASRGRSGTTTQPSSSAGLTAVSGG